MKEHTPRIHETLNDGVDVSNLSKFLKERDCKKRGHLAFWTEINGQLSNLTHLGFFGSFEFSNNRLSMHLLPAKSIMDFDRDFRTILAYEWDTSPISHFIAYWGTSVHQLANQLAILSSVILKDGSLVNISRGGKCLYPQGDGAFIGLMKWYRDSLYKNNFRVERTGAINRMPRNDTGGSVTITRGLRIQVRSLYIPESYVGDQVTYTYEFELDGAPGQYPPEGILKSRHFEIWEDGRCEKVDGPGVVGKYPRIGPDMDVFRYNSCIRFSRNSRDCWMQGSFLFRLPDGTDFEALINRSTFNWRTSPVL